MGKKKGKNPNNAFSYFLDDYVQQERKKGRDISHKLGAEECASKWKELPEEEKEYFRQIANTSKMDSKNLKHNKFTTTGISYAELEEKMKKAQEKIEKEDREIKTTIHQLDYDLIKTQLFYIVHCNYYCKTFEGNYIPGEIAISEFSLEDGLKRSYHTLISPENIPLGFAFEAKTNIDEIHGLPFPSYPEGESDYLAVYRNILEFLKPGKLHNEKFPPLYCIESNISASENIFNVLAENDRDGKNPFRILLLHKLFFWLKNKCVQVSDEEKDSVGFPVMSNAIIEIEKDIFRYVPGISCVYHCDIEEKYHNCSLSIVQRFVYVICDHCCQFIDIKLIPGKHCRTYPDTVESATIYNDEAELKPKPKQANNIGDICSFYAGSNVAGWTKVTSSSFLEDSLDDGLPDIDRISISSRGRGKPTFTSVTAGRGKLKSSFNSSSYENDFPALRGRGRRVP